MSIGLVIVSGWMTLQVHMLDLGVKKPFGRGQLKSLHSGWLMHGGVLWLLQAKQRILLQRYVSIRLRQHQVNPEFAVRFKKCCISKSVDRGQDDLLETEVENSEDAKTGEEWQWWKWRHRRAVVVKHKRIIQPNVKQIVSEMFVFIVYWHVIPYRHVVTF